MRKNAMTKCAVGAMLFGGTLGLAQLAQAGVVTWLSGFDAYGNGDPAYVFSAQWSMRFAGNWGSSGAFEEAPSGAWNTPFNFPAHTHTYGSNSSTFSGTTNGGAGVGGLSFSADWTGGPQDLLALQMDFQTFTVTGGPTLVTLFVASGLNSNSNNGMDIVTLDGTVVAYVGGSGGTQTVSLDNGTYRLGARLEIYGGSISGTAMSFSVVPAPSALALLGAAGLVGGRRRRA